MREVTDAAGGKVSYEYDAFGNLRKTTDPSGNEIVVTYDDLGRKIRLKDPDLGEIKYELDPLGQLLAQTSPEQAKALQKTTFEYDALGRMTARYEPDLNSYWVYDTAEYGIGKLAEAYTGKPDRKDYRRVHEMLDQLDLVHMNGRVYDPFVAQFLSGDLLIADPSNGQNYNRYSYVLNNPTNLVDPTGFAAEGEETPAPPQVVVEGESDKTKSGFSLGSFRYGISTVIFDGAKAGELAAIATVSGYFGSRVGGLPPTVRLGSASSGGYVGAKAAAPTAGAELGQTNFGEIATQVVRRAMADFADNNRGQFGFWGWAAEKADNYFERPNTDSAEGKSAGVVLIGLGVLAPGGGKGKTAEEIAALAKGESAILKINPKNLVPDQAPGDLTGSLVKRYEKAMKANGYGDFPPITGVVRPDGRVVISDGHHRAQAAIRAGLAEVPVEVYKP